MCARPLRNAATGIAVIGLAAALLAGCATGAGLLVEQNRSGHILLSDAQHDLSAPGEPVEGTLTLVGPCLGLDTGIGDFVTVFPKGSALVASTDQVAIPGWGTLRPDDRYLGEGRIRDSSSLDFHDAIPAECRASRILVLNPIR